MREMFIGEIIRRERLESGKTQEELCAGVCDPSTLSRIETGKQAPSRNVANVLLQRLGQPYDRYYTSLTASEAEAEALRTKIDSCAARFQQSLGDEKRQARLDALEQLDRLESLMKREDNITRQYILAMRAALGGTAGPYRFEVKLNMLLKAIRLTVPKFDLEMLDGRLYSIDETEIISQIAGTYSEAGQHEKAADIFNQLLTYVREHYQDQDLTNPARYLSPATLNYARELCLAAAIRKRWTLRRWGRGCVWTMDTASLCPVCWLSWRSAGTLWESPKGAGRCIVRRTTCSRKPAMPAVLLMWRKAPGSGWGLIFHCRRCPYESKIPGRDRPAAEENAGFVSGAGLRRTVYDHDPLPF